MSDDMKDCIVGPIETYNVKVDGRLIPRLTASPVDETRVELILDGRWSITLNKWDFRPVASMVANALAIGEGYSHLGASNKDMPFAPQVCDLSSDEGPRP